MLSHEQRSIDPGANRAEKRRRLEVFRHFRLNSELKAVFKDFTFSEADESRASEEINRQLKMLTGVANGSDKEESYQRLMSDDQILGKPISLYEAMMPTNGDKSEYLFSCFYQGKLVRQVTYQKGNDQIKSLSDFFYFQHADGGDGVVELRHDIASKGRAEIFYERPVTRKELESAAKRDDQDALILIKEGFLSTVHIRSSWHEDEFQVRQRSTYDSGIEIARRVVYQEQKNNFYSFNVSLGGKDEDLLVVRRHLSEEQIDEQWLLAPDPHKNLDYVYLLEDLIAGFEPHEDETLTELCKIYVDNGKNKIRLLLEGESLEGEVITNDGGDPAMIFIDREDPTSLMVSIDPDNGDVKSYNYQEGIMPKNPSLN